MVLRAWLAKVSEAGVTDRVRVDEPPMAGNTAKSEIWPAAHPVFAVMFTRTYLAVTGLNVIVTVLLLAFGSNVYPAELTIVEKFEPSVEPRTDSVSVLVFQAVSGGSLSVTWSMLKLWPRSTWAHCGNVPFTLSQ